MWVVGIWWGCGSVHENRVFLSHPDRKLLEWVCLALEIPHTAISTADNGHAKMMVDSPDLAHSLRAFTDGDDFPRKWPHALTPSHLPEFLRGFCDARLRPIRKRFRTRSYRSDFVLGLAVLGLPFITIQESKEKKGMSYTLLANPTVEALEFLYSGPDDHLYVSEFQRACQQSACMRHAGITIPPSLMMRMAEDSDAAMATTSIGDHGIPVKGA